MMHNERTVYNSCTILGRRQPRFLTIVQSAFFITGVIWFLANLYFLFVYHLPPATCVFGGGIPC